MRLGGVLGDNSVDQLVKEFGSEEVVFVVLYEVGPSYRVLALRVADFLPILEAYLLSVLGWKDVSDESL